MFPAATIAASVFLTLATAPVFADGCAGDLNADGNVDAADLAVVLGAWETAGPGDLTGDGIVDGRDLGALLGAWGPCELGEPLARELASQQLSTYPWANFVQTFQAGDTVYVSVDPTLVPAAANASADVYVIENRTQAEWDADRSLADVRGAPESVTFGATIDTSVKPLVTSNLATLHDLDLGTGYDLVVDVNLNGILDSEDLIDGRGDEAGFWMVTSLTDPGPLPISQIDTVTVTWPGLSGSFDNERWYYPTDIQSMTPRPLVVISHGNGHQYTWYDYIGQHLSAWGYIVMVHQNNTGPGVEQASTTTLQHTDAIIGLQATAGGGVLNGKIDSHTIIWIGHSRGGEGVVRAYDRIFDNAYTPQNYTKDDIKLINSIAPTDFLGPNSANPHLVPYFLIYGSSDGDVCGCPDNDVADSFNLYERAQAERSSMYIQGASHNYFCLLGINDWTGPAGTNIGRPATQTSAKAQFLALVKYHIEGQQSAKEYLWRQYENLRPLGVGANIIADFDYKDPSAVNPVIDDFQTNSSTGTSSSGGAVTFDVANVAEGLMNDNNLTFTWSSGDAQNGNVRGRTNDVTKDFVFDYATPTTVDFAVVPSLTDFTTSTFLSIRAAQGTRHTQTVALNGTLTFSITLIDQNAVSSTINIGAYKGGLERPYQRTGFGSGAGWQNEWEVIRVRLTDFLVGNTGIDLAHVATVRLNFGAGFGSDNGRVAIDDIMLDKN